MYEITVRPEGPDRIDVSLHLPETSGTRPETLVSRAAQMHVASQVRNVKCDGRPLESSEDGVWTLPPHCRRVTWVVDAVPFDPEGTGPAEQQSFSMGGWWLFSGPSSLLRIVPEDDREASVRLSAPGMAERTEKLPPLSAPPAFFVLGDAPARKISEGDLPVTYFGNDLSTVTSYVDPDGHMRAVRYFARIVGEKAVRKTSGLGVVWFGVPRSRAEISGAAGHNMLLANYIFPADQPKPEEFYLPFVLVLHEQFHQISVSQGPVWASESLAQYYALKAAKKMFPDNEAFGKIYARAIAGAAPSGIGLLTVQHQVNDLKDYRNYGLFYSQGMRFWAEIDRALSDATSGETDLDAILPAILAAPFDDSGSLPPAVMKALAPIGASELDKIIGPYLIGSE